MSAVVLYVSMSLDGFTAAPEETIENGLGDEGLRLHSGAWVPATGRDERRGVRRVYGSTTASDDMRLAV